METAMRLTLIFAAALVVASAASAQQTLQLRSTRTPEQREAAFKAADANKDGKLDLAEFKSSMEPEILAQIPAEAVAQIKDQRDTDRDGFVSHTEYMTPGRIELHP
jgi:Ca2+-binding EF-hand superfamily protein